ncbi:MAG: hypothetical protein JST09_02885 [Bacteroidetes bacterium]|nr:hypothetical protein [Bacteroidota bacterium]
MQAIENRKTELTEIVMEWINTTKKQRATNISCTAGTMVHYIFINLFSFSLNCRQIVIKASPAASPNTSRVHRDRWKRNDAVSIY